MLTIQFTGADGKLTQDDLLTAGMVGKQIKLCFDTFWSTLEKIVVFVAGGVCRTCRIPTAQTGLSEVTVTIPPEVLLGGQRLLIGVYGYREDDTDITPTVMVKGPRIRYGADPTESPDGGNLPIWQTITQQIGQLEELNTQAKDSLVAAINEILETSSSAAPGQTSATFTPHVSEDGVLSWSNDQDLSNPAPVNIKGEKGDPGTAGTDGTDGKSAYRYAIEGGFGGSEADFYQKMAQELPTALPNPHKLTFTGGATGSYDGSSPLTVSIPTASGDGSTSSGSVFSPGTICYHLLSETTTEEQEVIAIDLSDEILEKLEQAEQWLLEVYMPLSGTTNEQESVGNVRAGIYRNYELAQFCKDIPAIPTTSVSFMTASIISARLIKGIHERAFAEQIVCTHRENMVDTDTIVKGTLLEPLKTGDRLRILDTKYSYLMPAGTKIDLYAIGQLQIVDLT